jgi:hypothetical protein
MRKMTSKLFPSMGLAIWVVLIVLVLPIGGIRGLAARVAAVVQADLRNMLTLSMPAQG